MQHSKSRLALAMVAVLCAVTLAKGTAPLQVNTPVLQRLDAVPMKTLSERAQYVADVGTAPRVSGPVLCPAIAVPPAMIATESKYDQADVSRSTLGTAALSRSSALQPIRNAIRALTSAADYACTVRIVANWAAAGSFTQMRSEDAYLTRDRFVSEIVLALLDADTAGAVAEPEREQISKWLSAIADDTITFYTYRAGPNSKRNNHRYWAGLSVGAIGYFTAQKSFLDWGDRSYALGVCQVDGEGLLPLELARGSQALNYHIYAYRPLAAYAALAARHGNDVAQVCGGGLVRLKTATLRGLSDPGRFAALAGQTQASLASDASFSWRLQMANVGLAAAKGL